MNKELLNKFYIYGQGFLHPVSADIWTEMENATGIPCLYEFPQEDKDYLWETVGYDFRSAEDGYEEFMAAVRMYVYLLTGIVSLNENFTDDVCAGILTRPQDVAKVLYIIG